MSQGSDSFGCIANTIKVASGHYVDLLNPDKDSIDIYSIAAALSKICRFGGHCPRFYSVAEHCIHATALAGSDGYTGEALKAILLHDAAEAYVGDMVKPLKIAMPEYVTIEQRIESAIGQAFNVDFGRWHDVIKHFDRIMLKAEKTCLWPNDNVQWSGFAGLPEVDLALFMLSPSDAEIAFLELADVILNNEQEHFDIDACIIANELPWRAVTESDVLRVFRGEQVECRWRDSEDETWATGLLIGFSTGVEGAMWFDVMDDDDEFGSGDIHRFCEVR